MSSTELIFKLNVKCKNGSKYTLIRRISYFFLFVCIYLFVFCLFTLNNLINLHQKLEYKYLVYSASAPCKGIKFQSVFPEQITNFSIITESVCLKLILENLELIGNKLFLTILCSFAWNYLKHSYFHRFLWEYFCTNTLRGALLTFDETRNVFFHVFQRDLSLT